MLFERPFEIRWADIDANLHLRHTVYADFCATLRVQCLAHFGFGMHQLAQLRIGPVLFQENLSYRREVRPEDKVRVNMRIGGASEDGRKWRICHEVIRERDNEVCASIEIIGAWMSLEHRKIVPPPEELKKVFQDLERTPDYKTL